jgi:hypothetical protein
MMALAQDHQVFIKETLTCQVVVTERKLGIRVERVTENLLDLLANCGGSRRKLQARLLHLTCEGGREGGSSNEQQACRHHSARERRRRGKSRNKKSASD